MKNADCKMRKEKADLDWALAAFALARFGRQKGLCIWQFVVSGTTDGNVKCVHEHVTTSTIGAQWGRQVAR
jgi:hypothetical protein